LGSTDLANATALTVQIFPDNGAGLPDGVPVYSKDAVYSETWAPDDAGVEITGQTSVKLTAVNPPTLTEGDYFVVFWPDLNVGVNGQWYWTTSDSVNGEHSKQINPGGGFGFGTDWIDSVATEHDLAFTLWTCADDDDDDDDDDNDTSPADDDDDDTSPTDDDDDDTSPTDDDVSPDDDDTSPDDDDDDTFPPPVDDDDESPQGGRSDDDDDSGGCGC
jgi:hypothetical protein